MPKAIAMTLRKRVAALIIKALLSASPDKVIRTSPVPDAHMIRDMIAPMCLRISDHRIFLIANGAADRTADTAINDRRWLTGIREPIGT